MVFRESPLGPVGSDHRRAERLGEGDDLLGAAEHLHFFAHQDGGTLRLPEQLQGLFHPSGVALGHSGVPGAEHFHVGLGRQQVGGYFQFDRSRAPRLEPLEGLHQVVGNGLHLVYHGVPVGHGLEHPQLVFGLVGYHFSLTQELPFHVGGDFQHGRTRKVGLAHRAQ